MTTKQTNEVTDKMINTVEVEGVKLFVSNVGQIYDQNGKEIRQQTITNKQTGYTNPYKFISLKIGKGKFKRVQVSRLVCMAFHPVDNPDDTWTVPEILLSGHEAKIKEWEYEQALARTQKLRPDLLVKQLTIS